jgi:5-formyltetrahydrofolate cyclo-ligase
MAFDKKCNRMGYGKAYYDTFFLNYTNQYGILPPLAALSLDEQVLDHVPTESHDVQLDMVVTPSLIYNRHDN